MNEPKDIDCLHDGELPSLDPPDVDYKYCAKVMLLATPTLAELYRKTLGLKEDGSIEDDAEPTHPNRSISFLVGLRGKSEVLAIGGGWSPSLDGADPESNPGVLVKTAIRTTLALTGVDLSKCTQWYKFLELRYRRVEKETMMTSAAGGSGAAVASAEPRVDTVVIFVPDIWNLVPTKLEFEQLQAQLKDQLAAKIADLDKPPPEQPKEPQPTPPEKESTASSAVEPPTQPDVTKTEDAPEADQAAAKAAPEPKAKEEEETAATANAISNGPQVESRIKEELYF